MKTHVHFGSYRAPFFLEREIFRTKVIEKVKTHLMHNNFFFVKNRAVYEIMWTNMVEPDISQITI